MRRQGDARSALALPMCQKSELSAARFRAECGVTRRGWFLLGLAPV